MRLFEPPPEIEGERSDPALRADVELARATPDMPDAERDAFLASPVGERLLARLRLSQLRERRRHRLVAWAAFAAGAAGLALGVTLWPRAMEEEAPPDTAAGAIRLKGGSSLAVYRKRGDEAVPIADGARLRSGDKLRFVVRSTHRYLMIIDVEERGAVRPFYPYPAGASLRLEPGRRHELPGSIELDESTGTERIVAIFSERALRFEEVRAAVEEAYPRIGGRRALTPPVSLKLEADVVSLRIEKGQGP